MSGKYSVLIVHIRPVMLYCIHRKSLAAIKVPEKVNKAVKVVNCIKAYVLKSNIFDALSEEILLY
jgi:hypothetical protein